jgi:hypothetical protein
MSERPTIDEELLKVALDSLSLSEADREDIEELFRSGKVPNSKQAKKRALALLDDVVLKAIERRRELLYPETITKN